MDATVDRVDAIRERADAATEGPWAWRGYVNGSVELRTVGRGGQRVVTSMRSEPCVVELLDGKVALTFEACESCQAEAKKEQDRWVDYRCPKQSNLDTVWLRDPDACVIKPANAWAVREASYRDDVASVEHPDAAFIAHAREDVPYLLDRLAQVEAERDGLRDKVESDFEIEAIHGWFGLTYANYLTLPRSILQSMPDEWQVRFVRMLNEMEEAIEGVVEWPEGGYRVQAINNTGRFVRDPVPPYNRGRTRLPLNPSTPRPPLVQEPEEGT